MVDKVPRFIQKISQIAKSLSGLIDNNTEFKSALEKAGTIGALISLGIDLYTQIKEDLKTEEERLFYSFFKIAFESAKESILAADIDEISLNNSKSKNVKENLFKSFTDTKEWNSYLPDHPVIVQFRTLICDILLYEDHNHLVRDFVFKFNIKLEEKADNDPNLKDFKKWSGTEQKVKNIIEHLEYSRSLIYKSNPVSEIGGKPMGISLYCSNI